ncbi:MAG: DUF362 domain-containing protein [Spirochaetes bacterium]|nr:DUF362 domain-containing protein [Spirochaetota bacterium]
MRSSSVVVLARVPSYDRQAVGRAVRRSLELLGVDGRGRSSAGASLALRPLLAPGASANGAPAAPGTGPVLLKPNLLAAVPPEEGVTTHPVVFAETARALRERGYDLAYGDSPGFGHRLGPAARRCGLAAEADRLGIPLADFEQGADVHWPKGVVHRQFHVARSVLGARALVNLPKLKTHGLTTVTGALKNTFGVIPGFRKAEYHVTHPDLEGFSRMLADLNGLVRSGLVVMDAICAMEGNGPRGGTLVPLGLLIVSDDAVAVDAVACRIMGIDADRVPVLRMAEEAGIGCASGGRIEIRGDPIEGFAGRRFALPPVHIARKMPGFLFRAAKGLMVPKPSIVVSRCRRCGECVKACPVRPKALSQEPGAVPRYEFGRCIRCFCCQESCPHGAVEILPAPLAGLFDRG